MALDEMHKVALGVAQCIRRTTNATSDRAVDYNWGPVNPEEEGMFNACCWKSLHHLSEQKKLLVLKNHAPYYVRTWLTNVLELT